MIDIWEEIWHSWDFWQICVTGYFRNFTGCQSKMVAVCYWLSGILGNKNRRLQKDKMGSMVSEEGKCSITSPAIESNLLSLLAPQWDGTNSWRWEGARHRSAHKAPVPTWPLKAILQVPTGLCDSFLSCPSFQTSTEHSAQHKNQQILFLKGLQLNHCKTLHSHSTGSSTGMCSGRSQMCFSGPTSGSFVLQGTKSSTSAALKSAIFHHKEVSAFHLGMKCMLLCFCTPQQLKARLWPTTWNSP